MNLARPKLEASAMQLLVSFPWPGNIRELQNVLFRAVALNEGGDIILKGFPLRLHNLLKDL